jgi:glycosyltransferase involved in cell wall biosynthesis
MTAALKELAERLGIGSEVEIGGAVPMDRLGEHFAGLDLFVLPSRSEAFALTVGEALACGVPAVVTTAAPWGDVERMGCGWSVAPTVAGLAEALSLATALPPADLEAMGRRGRDWVRADYAWSEVARRHVSELYDVRGETRPAAARA